MWAGVAVTTRPRSSIVVGPLSGLTGATGDSPGGGGGSVALGLPFDFKAYRATVELATATTRAMPPPPNPIGIPGLALDQDVTWCSQWGKTVDLTFRFYTPAMPSDIVVPAHLQWATISGIGITMSGYRQPITMMVGTLGGAETQGELYPFELVMLNEGDFREGYVLENMVGFTLLSGKAFYFKGNEQLITRTYHKDGWLVYDPDDFT